MNQLSEWLKHPITWHNVEYALIWFMVTYLWLKVHLGGKQK